MFPLGSNGSTDDIFHFPQDKDPEYSLKFEGVR